MAIILSSLVFTQIDIAGNPHTEAYISVEFRDARYSPGGEAIDISAVMRRIEVPPILAQLSGAVQDYEPRPNVADFPGNAGSGRLELYAQISGNVTVNVSGIPFVLLSGVALKLVSNARDATGPLSGRLMLGASGNLPFALGKSEILSGTAVSGIRAMMKVIGE